MMVRQESIHSAGAGAKRAAMECLREGKPADAVDLLQQVCATSPEDVEARFMLGSAFATMGNFEQAVAAFRVCVDGGPDNYQHHFALGKALNAFRQPEPGIDCFRAAIELQPGIAEMHLALANALHRIGTSGVREECEKVLEIDPNSADAYRLLAKQAEDNHDFEKALKFLEQALEIDPESSAIRIEMALVMSNTRRRDEAEGLLEAVLERDPGNLAALAGLARNREFAGDYEAAWQVIEPLLDKEPAHTILASVFVNMCDKVGRCEEAIAYAEKVLTWQQEFAEESGHLHMSVALRLDKMGRYEDAFAHCKAGNADINMHYDPVGQAKWIEETIQLFNKAFFWQFPKPSTLSERPIFIVGMPRSGTTLTEQIIGSHPDVYPAGELSNMSDLKSNLPGLVGSPDQYPECVKMLTPELIDQISADYLSYLDELSPTAKRVTDKMPHNFIVLGLIQILFPGARVIHCKRDPMDTCLSIYFQNFRAMHAYARDLFFIGSHYHQYQRLMEHWKHTITLPILEVQYEELVQNQEAVSREMIEFCGLEWNESCLDFHRLDRVAETASYAQVRKPMYKGSIEKWRRYELWLDNLKEGLERGY